MNTHETVARAAAALRLDLAPQGALEECFFEHVVRATILIDRCEQHLETLNIESPEYLKHTRLMLAHRRWLTSSLKFLAQLQAERAERQPQAAPTRLANTVRRKLKPRTTDPPAESAAPEQTQIARSAPCPCGSGQKYKRCCGHNAPPLLGKAA